MTQREQHRRGDLERRGEDADERVLARPRERAEAGRLGERDELVRAREAPDDPAVAADRDEDQHAHERVDLREDGPGCRSAGRPSAPNEKPISVSSSAPAT